MLFPSNIFLFCFLPVVLVLYYGGCHVLLKKHMGAKNILLLIASLIFYAYGEGWNLLLLIVSIGMNYVFGLLLERQTGTGSYSGGDGGILSETSGKADGDRTGIKRSGWRRPLFVLALAGNLGILFVFKYLDFVIANCNRVFHTNLPLTEIALPIGISFFTFQALSYIIDVYRGTVRVQRNPIKLGLYIALFPQLVAGPVVRYDAIEMQMDERKESYPLFGEGVVRFIVGLGKKVLLADTMALFASRILTEISGGSAISVSMAWLGAVAYTLQIYYDFSAYSDMAIGMGRLFGFHLPENFNYPYISKSITEFWRRWHMTLGSWFRDYVYIPLGGSRRGIRRTCFNLLVVFALTGLWHGIGWQFLSWGLFYGILLVLEKSFLLKWMERCPAWIRHCYTMLMVILGFVIFRSSSLPGAWTFLQGMSGMLHLPLWDRNTAFYFRDLLFPLCLFIPFSMPILPALRELSSKNQKLAKAGAVVSIAAYPLVFLLCSAWIITETPQPFLYFQF